MSSYRTILAIIPPLLLAACSDDARPPLTAPPNTATAPETDAVNALVAAGHAMAGMEIPGRWVDVRDPGVLAELEKESAASNQ